MTRKTPTLAELNDQVEVLWRYQAILVHVAEGITLLMERVEELEDEIHVLRLIVRAQRARPMAKSGPAATPPPQPSPNSRHKPTSPRRGPSASRTRADDYRRGMGV
jgi:hypothetical protein